MYFKSKIVDCALDIFLAYVCATVIFFDTFLGEDRVEKVVSHNAEKLVIKT